MNIFDVAIVGAGPAGSTCALYLSKYGFSVALLQKGSKVGEPLQCAEGIIARVIDDELPFYPSKEAIATIANKALIKSPNAEFTVNFPKGGIVLNRRIFDPEIAQYATNLGAELFLDFNAVKIDKVNCLWSITSKNGLTIQARALVGADGVGSFVGRSLTLVEPLRPDEVHTCIQVVVEGIKLITDRIELYLLPEIAPGGYVWVFPKGDNKANIGLGCHRSVWNPNTVSLKERLIRFIRKRASDARTLEWIRGITPAVMIFPTMAGDGVLLVGDAARVTDPFSGGGIHNAIRTGHLAADWLKKGFDSNDLSATFLKGYEREWIKRRGFVHKLLYRTSFWIREAKTEDIDKMVSIAGDIFADQILTELKVPYVLASVMLRHPAFALKAASIFLKQ